MAANSVAGGKMWPQITLIQTFIGVLVTCKNEQDPFKNEGDRVVTSDPLSMQIFYDVQGKLIPQSEFGSTSNSSKLLWLSLLHDLHG